MTRNALFLCTLIMLSGCSSTPKARPPFALPPQPEPKTSGSDTAGDEPESVKKTETDPELASMGFKIIDAHVHTEFTDKPEPVTGIPVTKEQFYKELRAANARGAVSHVHRAQRDFDWLGHRGIIHCAGIGERPGYAAAEAGLRSGKLGCIKIYLGYNHVFAYDRRYYPLYKLAEKYDVPVVFHTGDTYSAKAKLKYADPLTIDEVAVDFPKVRFVIAHVGNPWIQSAAEVAYKNPNVYLDGSALLIGNLDEQPRDKVEEFVVKPLAWVFGYLEDPRKLMFASDWPLNNIAAYAKAFKRAIPKEHWKAVFHDNAVKVFKFPSH